MNIIDYSDRWGKRLTHFLQATQSSGCLLNSFKLSPVHSFTSSNFVFLAFLVTVSVQLYPARGRLPGFRSLYPFSSLLYCLDSTLISIPNSLLFSVRLLSFGSSASSDIFISISSADLRPHSYVSKHYTCLFFGNDSAMAWSRKAF